MSAEALPSWRNRSARQAILELVRSTSVPGEGFVEPAQRIATFDNDGTLWCEKPMYVQADFLVQRWRELAEADPAKCEAEPYKAAVEGDEAWLAETCADIGQLIEGTCEAFASIAPENFEAAARKFFESARHPRFGLPYTRVVYRPMRELLDLLGERDFRVFIATAGEGDFVRTVSEELYGVPREHVIGSTARVEQRDGRLVRLPEPVCPINDGPAKPAYIRERIGRPPLLAVGNADGDVPMLETARHGVLLRHDDAEREYAYGDGAEKAFATADQRGWTVLSMRDDFATVFG